MLCLPLIRSLQSRRCFARPATLGAWMLGILFASATAASAAPDLIAEKITLKPNYAYLGATTFTMSLTVRNAGTSGAGAQTTRIFASSDSEINGAGNDVLIFTLPVPALAAGKSLTFTSVTTPRIIIDPNRVGPNGTDYLPKGTYYIGVQVDVANQVTNEVSEKNFFTSGSRLTVMVNKPAGPPVCLPVSGTNNISVARALRWTTVTNANRYDVYLTKLKDTVQTFYPHPLVTPKGQVQRVVLTDMQGLYNPHEVTGTTTSGLPNNTPDLLIAQEGNLLLYNHVVDDRVGVPRYRPPFPLYETKISTNTQTTTIAGRKYASGTISALAAANMNFYYTDDRNPNTTLRTNYMDAVFATYGSGGGVYVVMNKLDGGTYPGGSIRPNGGGGGGGRAPSDLASADIITSTGHYAILQAGSGGSIKSMVVADFDHDSDLDIITGGDINSGMTLCQSDYRNSRNGDNDPRPLYYPEFTQRSLGNLGVLSDVQDMAVADIDRDGRPDIIAAAYHSDSLWVLYNNTNVGGNNRTTRTVSLQAVGPLPTNNEQTTTIFRGANTVCVQDLNNDNLPDFAAGCYFDGKVVVYENRSAGAGGFSLSEVIPHVLDEGLPNLEKVTSADINGDGLFDILASSATDDMIMWYENQGFFTFKPHLVTKSANRVGGIVVGDMNNDLMPDIISYSQYDNTLTWFMSWPGVNSNHLIGRDLIAARCKPRQEMSFNTTYVWKVAAKTSTDYSTNSGLLTFRTQPTRISIDPIHMPLNPIEPQGGLAFEMSTLVDGPLSVNSFGITVYADPILDRDFLMAHTRSTVPATPFSPLSRMYSIGSYSFGSYAAGAAGYQTPKFEYTQMPEGLYNIHMVASGNTQNIHDGVRNGLFDGIPDGSDTSLPETLTQSFTNPEYGDDVYLSAEKLAVIRKPGLPEKPSPANNAINVPTGSQLSWSTSTYATSYDVHMVKASSVLPEYTSITVATSMPNLQSIAVGDINGDTLPDVAATHVAGPNDARIYWIENRNNGRYFAKSLVAQNLAAAPLLAIADMDRDGKADLMAASTAENKIWWYKNKGGKPLVFGSPTAVNNNAPAINSIQAVDMDNDKDMDVLVASLVDNRLYYLARTSSGYTPRVIDASHGQALFARAIDLDQDGDMDVVASFWNPDMVAWYENKGGSSPTFVRRQLSSTINDPRWLAAGNLDGDSDIDIAVVSQSEGKIHRFLNNGAATPGFSSGVAVQGLPGPHGLQIVDFNHDSRADLVTATSTGNRIVYMANNGGTPPSFTQYTIRSYPSGVSDVATANMDNDNFNEVVGAAAAGTINWFDYVVDYNFANPLAKVNKNVLRVPTFNPGILDPAMGYRWQILARRTVPIYGGTLNRETISSQWTFFTGQSDLKADNITFTPTTLEQGQTVHFKITESNTGFSNSAVHYTDIYASPDPIVSRGGNDILLKRVYMGALAANKTVTVEVDVNTAAIGSAGKQLLEAGNYYIGIFADALNADNSESSKENNKFVRQSPRLQVKKRNGAGTWTDYQ